MCVNLQILINLICGWKIDTMRLSLGVFVDFLTCVEKKYFHYNKENATDATILNPRYFEHRITICAFLAICSEIFEEHTLLLTWMLKRF